MLNRLMILSVSLLLVFQTGLKAQVDLGPVQELILKEKFQEASKMLDGFIGEKPKNLDRVYFYLGQIAYLQEDFAGAKKFFETGLETKSKSPLNLAGMGMIKMKDQLYTDAYEFLEKAVSFAKGKDPEAAYAVADAYLEGGPQEIGEAKKILYQRRQSDEEDPRTYIKLGEYYKKQGVPELAIEELEKAIQKKADYVPAYVGLAELYYNRGKETRSGADFQTGYKYANKAIELNPDFGPAYRIRAELYLISQFPDKFERGKKDMEKYLSLQNNDEQAKVRYAQFLFLTEDYDNSLKAIGELESAGATNNVLRRLKGMALAEKGQLGPAQAALDDYFSKMDEKYRISQDYEVYGDILRMQGNLEKADEYYVEAMKRSDDRDGLFGEIADDYKGSAKSVEDEVKAIKAEANTFQGQAQTFYGEYQKIASMEAPTEEDAAKAADFRAKMDEAVAAGKAKLAEADAKSAEAKPFYLNEAHYRQKALEMADPVTLTHYRNLATSLYKAGKLDEADNAYQECNKLKADYWYPYKMRLRIAYAKENEDKETNSWYAKPVAEDIIKAFDGQHEGMKKSDLNSLLVAYEVLVNYNFNPTGEDGNYHCEDAQPWIDKIYGIDPNYARIKPISDYCADQK